MLEQTSFQTVVSFLEDEHILKITLLLQGNQTAIIE